MIAALDLLVGDGIFSRFFGHIFAIMFPSSMGSGALLFWRG